MRNIKKIRRARKARKKVESTEPLEILTISHQEDLLPYGIQIRLRSHQIHREPHFYVTTKEYDFRVKFADFNNPQIWNFRRGNESMVKHKEEILSAIREWIPKGCIIAQKLGMQLSYKDHLELMWYGLNPGW